MNKEKKLIPGLPSGFEDRWDKKLLLKKKLLKAIENNFIKFGAEALETPSFEISENIGSFLAEDDANPMSDVFSFEDGEKSITLRYDLSSPLARFVAQNNQELPSIFKRYAIQNVFRNEKAGNGRYREFMQADFDIVGNVNPAQANAELCNLISSTLLDCGLKKDQFTINIGNRKIVQGLIDDLSKMINRQNLSFHLFENKIPVSKNLNNLIKKKRLNKINLISNGDDYQVLFTADINKARIIESASKATGIKITKIGKIISGKYRSLIFDKKNKQIQAKSKGYIHLF